MSKTDDKETTVIIEENYSLGFYKTLNCSFYATDNTITKMNKQLREGIKDLKDSTESNQELYKKLKANLDLSYNMLMDPKLKERYMKYLFIYYTFSQPNTITQLKHNYCWYVFPYYLFNIIEEKSISNSTYLIIDNINFALSFYSRDDLIMSIESEGINNIQLTENKSIVLSFSNRKEDIVIEPAIPQQSELLYTLLYFMRYTKEQNDKKKHSGNIVQEKNQNIKEKPQWSFASVPFQLKTQFAIDQLTCLKDDIYIPGGIIIKGEFFIKSKGKHKPVFIILGKSLLGVFKDKTMTCVIEYIPLIPFETSVVFNHEKYSMVINNRIGEYEYFFKIDIEKEKHDDEMNIWNTLVNDLFERKFEDKIFEEKLNQIVFDKQYVNQINIKAQFLYRNLTEEIDVMEKRLGLYKNLKVVTDEYFAKVDDQNDEDNASARNRNEHRVSVHIPAPKPKNIPITIIESNENSTPSEFVIIPSGIDERMIRCLKSNSTKIVRPKEETNKNPSLEHKGSTYINKMHTNSLTMPKQQCMPILKQIPVQDTSPKPQIPKGPLVTLKPIALSNTPTPSINPKYPSSPQKTKKDT